MASYVSDNQNLVAIDDKPKPPRRGESGLNDLNGRILAAVKAQFGQTAASSNWSAALVAETARDFGQKRGGSNKT